MMAEVDRIKLAAIIGSPPVTQAQPRRRRSPSRELENTFEQRLLLALDGRRLAFSHRLADRGVLAQPLRLPGRIDDHARLRRSLPEDQRVDEAAVGFEQLGILLIDDLPNVRID